KFWLEAEGAQNLRDAALDQVDDGRLATMGSAEPQVFDRTADGPLDIVVQVLGDLVRIAHRVGLAEIFGERAGQRVAHRVTPRSGIRCRTAAHRGAQSAGRAPARRRRNCRSPSDTRRSCRYESA